jgi:polyisoprenoid-binding protein YceI
MNVVRRTWRCSISPPRAPRVRIALALLVFTTSAALGQVRSYEVDARRSQVTITVGKSGLFGFAGHAHEVVAPSVSGEVIADPGDPIGSTVTLSFETAALRVTGRGEPPQDVPKVQANMIGPKVLDVVRFPGITFRSIAVTGRAAAAGAWDLEVSGDLGLHGVTRRLSLPLRVQMEGDSLTASGTAVLRQTDFGIKPLTVGGVVKVKDEVTVIYRIAARAR